MPSTAYARTGAFQGGGGWAVLLACTKVMAPSLWMASATSAGRAEQLMSVGTNGSTSRLPTTEQHAVIASTAAVCNKPAQTLAHNRQPPQVDGR